MSKNAVMPMEDYVAACDSIREKTETTEAIKSGEIPEKINEVYETGKNTEWKALKGFATGTDALCISDISPIEHEMGVKVSGVEDLSAVKVRKYGGNLLDFPSTYSWKGLYSAHTNTNVKTVLKPNIRYALSYDEIEYSAQGDGLVFVVNGNAILAWTEAKKPNYFVLDKEVTDFYIYTNGWNYNASENTTATIKNLRIYLSENGYLEYEPYIGPTEYTPDADGVVSGVTSLYPSTTLMTDTDGVIIEATYNKALSKVDDMPERIEAVYDEGQIVGTEAGREIEHSRMWDVLQPNGSGEYSYNSRIGYFGSGKYTFDNFYPKYNIRPVGNADYLFYDWGYSYGNVAGSFIQRFKECDVMLDTSKATSMNNIFAYNKAIDFPTVDFSSAIGVQSGCFRACSGAKTIEKIIVNENVGYSGWFDDCFGLENITFEGVIGQNGIDLHWSTKLTEESLDSILKCLKGFQETTETHTITLGDVNLEKIPNVKKQLAQQKGWTLL